MKHGYSEAKWKEGKFYKLSIRGEETGYELKQHDVYPDMYHLIRPDGVSTDFYNLTRGKDNSIKLAINKLNKDLGSDLEGRT